MGQTDLNHAQNEVFGNFIKFGSYIFLEIEYDECLRQCLTSSRGKTHEKQVKTGPEIRFFAIFSSLAHYFSFYLYRMIAWNNFQLLIEVKLTKKAFWGLKLSFLPFSQACIISFP